jgi:polysaccharide lyase-like protein
MTVVNVTDASLKGKVVGPTFAGDVDGAKFTGSVTYADTAPIPPDPPPSNTVGKITNFNGANNAHFNIDGIQVLVQNPNKSWSLRNPDPYCLQFEVRPGDCWVDGSYVDHGNNRSEIEFSPRYNSGVKLIFAATLNVSGSAPTAVDFYFTQLHAVSGSPPAPFYLQIAKGDYLEVITQNPNSNWNRIYRAPSPIRRGQAMQLRSEVNMNTSGGYAKVWLDGNQIVNYSGAIGASNSQYYWKCGIYRGETPDTLSLYLKNLSVTTG